MPKELTAEEVQSFRQRLCESFTKLFAERGYSAVTMRALAEDIGCSPMTPYRYFKDKDEILAAARAGGFRRLSERLDSVVDAGPQSPAERAELAAQAFLSFARDEPSTYRLMYTNLQPETAHHPDLEVEISRARRSLARLAEIVPQIRSSGIQPAAVAQAYWAALHGVIQLHLNDSFDPETKFEEIVAVLLGILLEGGRAIFQIDEPVRRYTPLPGQGENPGQPQSGEKTDDAEKRQ
ncbi:TetR/AcrR family transcriptional regulator [bacterium]|nr:TetR/AcrR family transcriptional regulator [bacterium]